MFDISLDLNVMYSVLQFFISIWEASCLGIFFYVCSITKASWGLCAMSIWCTTYKVMVSYQYMCWKWTNMLQARARSGNVWTRDFQPYIKLSFPIRMQLHVDLGSGKMGVHPGEGRTVTYTYYRKYHWLPGYLWEVFS